jgi:hypothetical protein
VSHAAQLAGLVCTTCGGRVSWRKNGDAWDGWCKACQAVTVQRPFDAAEGITRVRQQELARPLTPMVDRFTVPIVGVTFQESYPDNVRAAEAALIESDLFHGEKPSAVLIRRPSNAHDPNAVEVHVPSVGTETAMLGHLPAAIARRLAPELDEGVHWLAWVRAVRTHSEHEDRPGIDVECVRVPPEE